jgi:hypothetical protein
MVAGNLIGLAGAFHGDGEMLPDGVLKDGFVEENWGVWGGRPNR